MGPGPGGVRCFWARAISKDLLADEYEVGEEGIELDPGIAALDHAELDLSDLVHEPDLVSLFDLEVVHRLVDLSD